MIAGTGVGGLTTLEREVGVHLERGPKRVSPFLVPMMMVNATAGLISMKHGFTGASLCVSTACASGANAIGEGLRMIRDGSADVVVCGGTEAAITPTSMAAFARMGALSTRNDDPTAASRPFDTARDGFVMGDGAAFLVLESWDRAEARGRHHPRRARRLRPHVRCPPHHRTRTRAASARSPAWSRPSPTPAWTPSAVTHINAHGTSTPLNDAAEAEAIAKIFGAQRTAGHLDQGRDRPPRRCGRRGRGRDRAHAARRAARCRRWPTSPTPIRRSPSTSCATSRARSRPGPVLSNSFGFGGHNVTLVLIPAEPMTALAAAVPPAASPATPLGAGRPGAADAALVELGGRTVAWFQVDSPSSADPDGTTEAAVVSARWSSPASSACRRSA